MILESDLTSSFKQIIRNELYDTGALYESMQIYSQELPGQILVKVVCNALRGYLQLGVCQDFSQCIDA